MKQVIVGTYYIGRDQVELVLREDTGGEFYVLPEKGVIPRIKVGADYTEWKEVVSVLLHEAQELLLERLRCRYELSDSMSNDHSQYTFVLPHLTFSELNVRLADFLVDALPDLAKAWEKWKKEKK